MILVFKKLIKNEQDEDLETKIFNEMNSKKKKKKKEKKIIQEEELDDEELQRILKEEEEEIKRLEKLLEQEEEIQEEKTPVVEMEQEEEEEEITNQVKISKKKKKKNKKMMTDDDFLFNDSVTEKKEDTIVKENFILEISVPSLNPDNEIKKIFGNSVLRQQKKKISRTTFFVTPKDHWPPYKNPGLEMKLINSDIFDIFGLFHSPEYSKIEEKFKFCVESHDPNNLIDLLHYHP
jgi:hypothetical protein